MSTDKQPRMEEQIADGQFSILIVIFAEKLKISNNAFFT